MTTQERAELVREIDHALMEMYQTGEWRGDIRQLLTRCRSALLAEAEDAKRYRWLEGRCLAADFDYGERHECVIVFRWPSDARIGQNLSAAIDAALTQQDAKP